FHLFAQFIDRDPSGAQLSQQALPLPVFVSDIKCAQAENQAQRASAETSNRSDNVLDLIAKEIAQAKEATPVEQRPECVREKKSADADSGHPRQRGCYSTHAREELGNQHASQSVFRKNVLCATNARVRFQRDAAEQAQHLVAAIPSEVKPED